MQNPQWTPEQQQAINADGRSLVVSAAAGSGKTAVLVERLLRILADEETKTPADRLVVATFTDAAAKEMKRRLNDGLKRLISQNDGGLWLQKQADSLPNANISTIHSFCFGLLREHADKINLVSDFRIITENEHDVFIRNVIRDILKVYYKKSPEKLKFLCDNVFIRLKSENDDKLLLALREYYKFSCNTAFFEFWVESAREAIANSREKLVALIAEKIEGSITDCMTALELAEDYPEDKNGENKLYKVIENDLNALKELQKNSEFYGDLAWEKLPTKPSAPDTIKLYRDFYKKKIKDTPAAKNPKDLRFLYDALENFDGDTAKNSQVFEILTELLKAVRTLANERKIETGNLSFDDAERLTLKLLADTEDIKNIKKTPLAKELSEFYSCIVVDEFQDVNDAQNAIFNLLSKGGEANRRGENIFCVGDIKQAIYGFRGTNPKIFADVLEVSELYSSTVNESGNAKIFLNKNFRSAPEVIDFCNHIFGKIMSEKLGGVDYDNSQKLVCGAFFPNTERTKRSPEFVFYPKNDKKTLQNFDENGADENADIVDSFEVAAVVKRIKQLLDEGAEVFENGVFRPCSPKDFAIICFKNHAKDYIDALGAAGIAAVGEAPKGFLRTREISVLLNILRIIDNPFLEKELLSVMLSPMFLFTLEEVTKIRKFFEGKNLYSAILELAENEENADYIARRKATDFLKALRDLRYKESQMSVDELIREIYERTDFYNVMQIFSGSSQKRANLNLLLHYAQQFQASGDFSLGGFLRYVDRIVEINGDFLIGKAIAPSLDAVRFLTIHKSKGLEFPFVFLVETEAEREFTIKENSQDFLFDDELGAGFKFYDKRLFTRFSSPQFYLIKEKKYAQMLDEKARLLYVALTRAKERLFITLNPNSDLKLPENAARLADWLRQGLDFEGLETFSCEPDFDGVLEEKQPPILPKVTENFELSKRLRNNFSFVYSSVFSAMPARFSVSELKSKSAGRADVKLNRPNFYTHFETNFENVSGAELGTALHKFLQFGQFVNLEHAGGVQKNNQDVKSELIAQIENLRTRNILTRKEVLALNENRVLGNVEIFLNSPLFKRIQNAVSRQYERRFFVDMPSLGENGMNGVDFAGKSLEKSYLMGVIDLIVEEEDGLLIVDYKNDRVQDIDLLREKYAAQLLLYSSALRVVQEKYVKGAVIYSFALGESIPIV